MSKVVIVCGSGDYTGGCRMSHLYGRALRAAGWSVSYVIGDRPSDGICLADEARRDGFDVLEEKGFFRLFDFRLMRRLSRHLATIRPEFVLSTVQCDLKMTAEAARRAKVPFIVFDQNHHRFYGPWPLRVVKRIACGFELRRAARIICVGARVAEQAIGEFKCQRERVVVLPNGIDIGPLLNGAGSADPLPRRNKNLRLLNVGRLDPQKGQKFLIEALSLLKDNPCELFLIGAVTNNNPESELYSKELQRLVNQFGFNEAVHFLGWRNDIAALNRACDIYVHSALWEGPPLTISILEAMALAKPVIITDCAGFPEGFVNGKHGFVVKAGDAKALADAIRKMIAMSPEQRSEAGRHAQEFVRERHDAAVIERQFVNLCEEVL